MKKALLSLVFFLLIAAAASWFGRKAATVATVGSVRSDAAQQSIPSGFLGIGWLATRDEVRAKRPSVIEEQMGMLSESTALFGRPAKLTYYFGGGNLVLFIFTFTDTSSSATFATTRTNLVQEYGAFPPSQPSTDEYGPKECATRSVKRFAIDHCLRTLGGVLREQIYFARTPG